jgi:hypothetical protein
MTAPKNVRHLTPEELSERLGDGRVPVDTLKKWRTTGQGPAFIRVGKYVLYREADVEAWEQTRLVTTTPGT